MLARFKKCLGCAPKPKNNLNLNDTLKPLYVFLTLFGLFPHSVKFQNQRFIIINKSIYINALCAVSMVLIMWVFVALHVQYILITYDNAMTDAIMTQTNYICEMLALNIFCIVAYVCAFMNRLKFVNMLNMFAKWTKCSNDRDKILEAIQVKVKLAVILLSFLFVSQLIVDFTRDDTVWKKILCNFTFIFGLVIQCTFMAFYYILVCIVGAKISTITANVNTISIKGKLASNYFINVECKSSLTLKHLELIYIEVFEVKQEISNAFQASILVTIVQSFHSIVSESHIIYHGTVNQTLSMHEIINCSFWTVCQIFKIYALSDCGNLLKVEILKLGQALYNVPTEKHDLNLLAQIQHFSTLMTYYGGDLTVNGLFSIDATLIFKVIASAAMYLIILVQLDGKK